MEGLTKDTKEIILITGGAGFLGQHLIKTLQERDSKVSEIRVVDLKLYENFLGHTDSHKVVSYVGDICQPSQIEAAFEGVDCVFHMAAYINFDFPPNYKELQRVNVDGTQVVIDLCRKYNVPRLVFTSDCLIHMTPYLGRANFTIVCNQTEPKTKIPSKDSEFQIPGYAPSKLKAETLVLEANDTPLANGAKLKTIAIRPPVIFGEGDQRFVPTLIRVAMRFGGEIPKIAGPGGKQQLLYAGNAAWAHYRAKEALASQPKDIAGYPVFVTDESGIEDTTRFCQRLSRANETLKLRPSWYQIPLFLSFFLAFLLELLIKAFNPIVKIKLSFPPCGLLSYLSSILLYNRIRASIYLDYEPIYSEEKAVSNSALWYEKWYQDYCQQHNLKKLKVK
ncbi:3 beta-hydroxysteroid dehydrogenase/Delta 5--_4-isomerase [Malaya genurostris]|uniref:3 beta-hydroxysteroid dehydrogenase/Delta 5-->4-isomerase n=1 Tax=Malaya genurostris TaxID=325434 RepID=UPI0026F39971|nr:3 beta-hydroxysteroid dehydrogenase/Delta 5-->4-isomerase [Malaya genurostris]XP_058462324.1 3 beta-hydroxysteroid dehydrogenase/Delta 5-->4-isomerase [Malaya genurostris]